MSVPRSMQRMVTVPRGSGMLAMMNSRKGVISGMLLVRVYAMDFFKLSKIRRPVGEVLRASGRLEELSPALTPEVWLAAHFSKRKV